MKRTWSHCSTPLADISSASRISLPALQMRQHRVDSAAVNWRNCKKQRWVIPMGSCSNYRFMRKINDCCCFKPLHFGMICYAVRAGRGWRKEEKGMTTEVEMAGWHHWLDGRESEWTPGVGDGQGGLACCNPWGCKESDTTEWLNWTELNWLRAACKQAVVSILSDSLRPYGL